MLRRDRIVSYPLVLEERDLILESTFFILKAESSGSCFISHSHKVTTCHPSDSRAFCFRRSRSLFRRNFSRQNSRFFSGSLNLQEWHRCQKHPCTNTASFGWLKEMSGLPDKLVG